MMESIKQMVVMLFSVAFIGLVAIIVLSSTAAAWEDEYGNEHPAPDYTDGIIALLICGVIGFILYGVLEWIGELSIRYDERKLEKRHISSIPVDTEE